MAVRATGGFNVIRYEPGNPQFPTLPDGIKRPHIIDFKRVGGFRAALTNVPRKFASAPANDRQRFGGWQTETTWINPTTIDFGVITSPIQVTVSLYNARFTPTDVTAVNFGTTGVSLISPTLTQTLQPYAGIDFTIEAGISGPADFDEFATFTTAEGDISFRIIGRRVFSLNVIPESPIIERLQFRTDLIRSDDGTEKAYSLLQSPNSALNFRVVFEEDDIERIKFRNEFIAGESALVVGVQKWHEARAITSPALSTDTTIQVDTSYGSFEAGKPISIVLPDGTPIDATIQSFDATSITFSVAIGTAIPRGSMVMPVGLGYVSKMPTYDVYPVNAEVAKYQVTVNQDEDQSALPGIFPTLNSTPILEFCNELSGAFATTSLEREEDILDSKLSNRLGYSRLPYADEVQQFQVTLDSRQKIWQWRQFFHYIRGSYLEIYVPTFQDDFPEVTTAASNVST